MTFAKRVLDAWHGSSLSERASAIFFEPYRSEPCRPSEAGSGHLEWSHQDCVEWCRSQAAIRTGEICAGQPKFASFSCLRLEFSLSFWCPSKMAPPSRAPHLSPSVSSSITWIYHDFYYWWVLNKIGPNPGWQSVKEWGRAPTNALWKSEEGIIKSLRKMRKKGLRYYMFFPQGYWRK